MSFVNRALTCEYPDKNAKKLDKKLYRLPTEINQNIARLKLKTMRVGIDTLAPSLFPYLRRRHAKDGT